jgi:hypothetical protein
MEPTSTCDRSSFIASCLNLEQPAHFYMDRLGLNTPNSERETSDDRSQICEAFHMTTSSMVERLSDHYGSRDDLRTEALFHHDTLLHRVTEALLSTYGPNVWSAAEPRLIRINEPGCLRTLVYSNLEDQEWLVPSFQSEILHQTYFAFLGSLYTSSAGLSPALSSVSKLNRMTSHLRPRKSRTIMMTTIHMRGQRSYTLGSKKVMPMYQGPTQE